MSYNYHIIANLGSNRDIPGTLKVYDEQGKLVLSPVKALGRGTNLPSNNYNHANQLMRNADTPSGVAECYVIGPGSSVESFGPHDRVYLNNGLSGNFLEAEKAGRSEILIHGGKARSTPSDKWYPLHPTHGCIRLSNDDMKELIRVLKKCGPNGKITII